MRESLDSKLCKIRGGGRRDAEEEFHHREIISKLREEEVLLSQRQPSGVVCRELERENARLKKLVADLALDKAMLQEAVSGK